MQENKSSEEASSNQLKYFFVTINCNTTRVCP